MKLLKSLKIHSTHVVDDGEILCTQVSEMSHIDRLCGNPLVSKSFYCYVLGDLALKLKRGREVLVRKYKLPAAFTYLIVLFVK